MAGSPVQFKDQKGNFEAFMDRVYEVKFSRSVPLGVILLSGVYAVYRSAHYLGYRFHLDPWVSWPTSLFIEFLVLGSGALVFMTQRQAFLAEHTQLDRDLAGWGVWVGLTLLGVSFFALLSIAIGDAWAVTQDYLATFLMSLVQIAQSMMIITFVILALLDEREDLRAQLEDTTRQSCPYCGLKVSPNNRARHIKVCSKNPTNQPNQP